MEAIILGHEDADPAVLRKKSIQRYAIFFLTDGRPREQNSKTGARKSGRGVREGEWTI